MRLLLDTNVAVWLLTGDRPRITKPAVAALEDTRDEVFVSAVVAWEIAIKRSLGKLAIGDGWAALAAPFDALPISAMHTAAVEHLPWHHRDPLDRLLVAQAVVDGCAIVTADPVHCRVRGGNCLVTAC